MKKAVPFLIVLFIGYYVLQDPSGAADTGRRRRRRPLGPDRRSSSTR